MRSKIAGYLLALYIVGNLHVQELSKLPALIQHFQDHHRVDNSMNFIDFLVEHYLEDIRTHADFADDMKLPYKASCHQHSTGDFYLFTPKITFENIVIIEYFTKKKSTMVERTFGHTLHNIWQPPRTV